jgi:hypothetical protein
MSPDGHVEHATLIASDGRRSRFQRIPAMAPGLARLPEHSVSPWFAIGNWIGVLAASPSYPQLKQ